MAESTVKKFVTPVFRVSFPNVFEARAVEEGQEKKFGLTAVWDVSKFTQRDKELMNEILKEVDRQCRESFKLGLKELPANFKQGLRDGAEKADLEGFGPGKKFASITSKMRPGVIDLEKNKISPEDGNADRIYPGCYARATVTVYTYNNKSKGYAIGLQNIQVVGDGARLDSRTDAAEDFDGKEVDAGWLEGQPKPAANGKAAPQGKATTADDFLS